MTNKTNSPGANQAAVPPATTPNVRNDPAKLEAETGDFVAEQKAALAADAKTLLAATADSAGLTQGQANAKAEFEAGRALVRAKQPLPANCTSSMRDGFNGQMEFDAGVALAKAGKPLPTDASAAAQDGYKSVPEPEKLTLVKAMTTARAGLGHALRSMVSAGVRDGDRDRNILENMYSQVVNELGAGATPSLKTVGQAAAELKKAATLLANHSGTNPDHLATARENAELTARHFAELSK